MTLPPSIATELGVHVARCAASRYVFPIPNGGPLRAADWRRKMASCRQGDRPRAHDLKHTGVGLLAAAGVNPSEIARRAGHAGVAFTYDHYGHLFSETDRDPPPSLTRSAPAGSMDGGRWRHKQSLPITSVVLGHLCITGSRVITTVATR